ncbi:MAG: hypothetical protein ABUS57_09725 [Pseudomonadota bacterium]
MSVVPISLEVDGVQHGWANMSIHAGEQNLRMQGFSYVTDAFDDLVRLGVNVALDCRRMEIIFDGEPAGWMWRFEGDDSRSWLSVFDVRDANHPDSEKTLALNVEVNRDQFAASILSAMTKLRSELGEDGFEGAWMAPFPRQGMLALQAVLS